jgi:hypothetical protein
MQRKTAGAAAGHDRSAAGSVACLAFVVLMGAAFWAGVVWIVESLMRVTAWW